MKSHLFITRVLVDIMSFGVLSAADHLLLSGYVSFQLFSSSSWTYSRLLTWDKPNLRFHGRDIFLETGRLPWKCPFPRSSVKSMILALLLSFIKVFRVLSFNSFCADSAVCQVSKCHTSALSSWHVFTVLLTYIPTHLVNPLASMNFPWNLIYFKNVWNPAFSPVN